MSIDRVTWRPKKVTLVGIWLFVAFSMGLFLSLLGSLDEAWDVLPLALLFLGPAAPFLLFVLRASITVDRETLEIANFGRAHGYRLEDVVAAVPGYWGVDVRFVGGGHRIAGAAQKSNYALMAGKTVRADLIAAEILNRAQAARGQAHGS